MSHGFFLRQNNRLTIKAMEVKIIKIRILLEELNILINGISKPRLFAFVEISPGISNSMSLFILPSRDTD